MPATTSYEVWKTAAAAKVYTKKTTSLGSTVTVEWPAPYDTKKIRPIAVHLQDAYTTTKWKSNGNRVLEKVEAGVEVSVLSKDGAWYKATTPNGNTGWMQAASLTLVASIAAEPARDHSGTQNPRPVVQNLPHKKKTPKRAKSRCGRGISI